MVYASLRNKGKKKYCLDVGLLNDCSIAHQSKWFTVPCQETDGDLVINL